MVATHLQAVLSRFLGRVALVLALVCLAPQLSYAATYTWNGGGGNNKWKTGANWGGTAPGANDDLVFGGTTQLTTDNNTAGDRNYNSITFDNTAGAFTLEGNRITLGGSVTNNDTDTQTINMNMILSGTRTFDAASGNLDVGGVLSGTGGGLTKNGSNTLTLSGTNTFAGTLTVNAGTLSIGSINNASANGVLGNSANAVVLGSSSTTGTLLYTGGTASSTKTFSLATSGTGAFDVSTAATNLTLSGVISGSGNMTKRGSGTLTLSGTNTFSGTLTVAAGTLAIGSINNASANGVLGNSANAVVLGSSSTTGTLEYTGGNATSNKTFSLASSGTGDFEVTTAATVLTLSGVISGSGNFTKSGSGILQLSGTNTYTGPTAVNADTLRAGAAAGGQAFGNLSAVTMADVAGATLDVNGFNQTIGSLAGGGTTGGNVVLNGGNLTFGGDNTSTEFSGDISGNGNLVKTGNGTFTVLNTISHNGNNGTITISAGTFQVGNGGTTGGMTSPINVINNGMFTQNRSVDRVQRFDSVISGTGILRQLGNSTYTLNGTNTYSGGTIIDAGTIRIGNAASLGSTSGNLTINVGSLDMNNFDVTVGNLTGTGGNITSSVAGNRTLTIGQGNNGGGNYQGVIVAGNGTTSLIKAGTGTITLSGNNTYTGTTTVNGGTLRVNGSQTGGGNYTVSSGATLGGTGSTTSALSIAGTLAPGAGGVETLGTGAVSFTNLSTFAYQVDSSVATGVGADLVIANGNLNLTGNVTLDLTNIAASPVAFGNGTIFALVNYAGSWNSGLFRVAGVDIADGGTFTSGLNTWRIDYNATTGGSNFPSQYLYSNYVTITAVPEPPVFVLLGAAGLAGFAIRRRRKRAAAARAA